MEAILSRLGGHSVEGLARLYEAGLHIAVILLLAWLALRYSGRAIRALKAFLMTQAGDDPDEVKRIDTLGRVFRYLASVAIVLVAAMLVLSALGISIAPVLATAGVLGIAVGFGAQSLVKDYFSGFFLLLEDQLRQGDVVEVAGKGGLVEEVTLRYIKLRDYEGNVHYVPNGAVSTVTNMSRGHSYSVIDVGVAYREDLDEVMAVMRTVGAALRQDPDMARRILDDLEMAGVDKWADSAVVIRCRFKVQPLEQWGVRREFLRRLKRAFDERGIEIPFPHLTVYPGQAKDGSAPALQMALDRRRA
ncbi:mechanosensitive ion channel family protein [Parasulfuritortus cantonensis]|uniref:Mechanosensitive ion channel family protein n=1 Tax=Parasulfuritortus cantonensis TaxID=2528202 RepID=A0A4R1BCB0_9PROT|nr:mechanosensitive ion channel family protein [Parasulfuritortus cantonensis]TCJ14675.1 mechanosensitive ion channel family protein [Parasulfuritortus cantonensis]